MENCVLIEIGRIFFNDKAFTTKGIMLNTHFCAIKTAAFTLVHQIIVRMNVYLFHAQFVAIHEHEIATNMTFGGTL